MRTHLTRLQLFWNKVDTSGECWEWTAGKFPSGYGCFNSGESKGHRAHRYIYEQLHGPIPPDLVVMHRCDNPACVRPDHLELGTTAQNQRDKATRNRSLFHERNPKAKLTVPQVLEIRARYDAGASLRELADCFGVTVGTIWFIGKRKHWTRLAS